MKIHKTQKRGRRERVLQRFQFFEFLSAKEGASSLSRVHKGFRIYLKYEQAGPNFSFNRGKKGGATLIIHDYLNACNIRGFSLIAQCRLCWEDLVQWVNDFGPT